MEFSLLESLPSVLPEVGLTILAIVVLLLDSYLPAERRRTIAYVAGITMAGLAVVPLIWPPSTEGALYWGGMIRYDSLAQIFKVMVLSAGAITSIIALDDHQVGRRGEFYLVIVVATLGGCLLAAAADLIMLFVALETLSIPLYILATFGRLDKLSAEGGLKYFLFGSFASAILLYGISFVFGFAGTTNIYDIATAIQSGVIADQPIPAIIALVMILAGFGFKISAVPFHFWTPDVYEGAPTPVTAFVSVASKAASFAILVRFLVAVFPQTVVIGGLEIENLWVNLVVIMSIVTMTFGNVLALRQSNIKRMLAYSSIAQAGYALIGVAAASSSTMGIPSISWYLFMYTFSNLLTFAGVIIFSEATNSEQIKDMAGLHRRSPWLALLITIGLLSLAGIPPAAGFIGKFFLFQAAVDANMVGLALIGVLNSIVALYYYLVVIKVMYVDRSEHESNLVPISRTYGWALGISAVVVILLGTIAASPILNWAQQGIQESVIARLLGF